MKPNSPQGRLEAAVRRHLKPPADAAKYVHDMTSRLISLSAVRTAGKATGDEFLVVPFLQEFQRLTTPPQNLRDAGRNTVRRELKTIANDVDSVIKRLEMLHRPAVLALSDTYRDGLRILRALAKAAREAKLDHVPLEAGRGGPKHEFETHVAAIVLHGWKRIAGKPPARISGTGVRIARGVTPLVEEIFSVLEIDASAKAAIEAAVRQAVRDK